MELNENSETTEETKLYVTDISIPAVWKSTEVGFYEYIYVVVFNGNGFSKGGCCVLRIPERQMTAAIISQSHAIYNQKKRKKSKKKHCFGGFAALFVHAIIKFEMF